MIGKRVDSWQEGPSGSGHVAMRKIMKDAGIPKKLRAKRMPWSTLTLCTDSCPGSRVTRALGSTLWAAWDLKAGEPFFPGR